MTEEEKLGWSKIKELILDYGERFREVDTCNLIISHVEDGLNNG